MCSKWEFSHNIGPKSPEESHLFTGYVTESNGGKKNYNSCNENYKEILISYFEDLRFHQFKKIWERIRRTVF